MNVSGANPVTTETVMAEGGVWGSYAERLRKLEAVATAAKVVVDQWHDLHDVTNRQRVEAIETLETALKELP